MSSTLGSSKPATQRSGKPSTLGPNKQANTAQTDGKVYMPGDKNAPIREKIRRVEHNATNLLMDMEGLWVQHEELIEDGKA